MGTSSLDSDMRSYNADEPSGGRVALAIHRCRKPTIAAMQGSAVGVGMTMTLPAIIRSVMRRPFLRNK